MIKLLRFKNPISIVRKKLQDIFENKILFGMKFRQINHTIYKLAKGCSISVARGGAGGAAAPPIMLFRIFVGTFANLSVHLEICRYM